MAFAGHVWRALKAPQPPPAAAVPLPIGFADREDEENQLAR